MAEPIPMHAPPPAVDLNATRALVWGPKFWFVLHSMAATYPAAPTEVTKRKYYDTIQNLPLFLPDAAMGDRFAALLDAHPVSPYLCSRASFVRWAWFIHNKINVRIGKPQVSLAEANEAFEKAMSADPRKARPRGFGAPELYGVAAAGIVAAGIVMSGLVHFSL
jgi:hypothetical protein